MFSFDGAQKLIILNFGLTDADVQSMYSAWKSWVIESDNAKYEPAFRSVGGDPTSPTSKSPSYFFLLNGWRVRPHEADHGLSIAFNLYVEGGGNPFVPTVGAYNVTIISRTSDVPGLAGIASLVWDEHLSNHQIPGSFGEASQQTNLAARRAGSQRLE